jgi:hypothetical protein
MEALAEPDESVGDEQHADHGEQEDEWHRASDMPGRSLWVEVDGQARRHQAERHADRAPNAQVAPQPAACRGLVGGVDGHVCRAHVLAPLEM